MKLNEAIKLAIKNGYSVSNDIEDDLEIENSGWLYMYLYRILLDIKFWEAFSINNHKDIYTFINHISNGGSIEEFFKKISYH